MTPAPHVSTLALALLTAVPDGGAPPLLAPVVNGVRVEPSAAIKPTTDQPVLRPAQDGSGDLLYDAGGFSARVTPDGTVNFRDKHFSALNLLPFLPTAAVRNIPSVQTTFGALMRGQQPPQADDRRANDGSRMLIPLLTRYRPDPREACRGCDRLMDPMLLNISGRIDLTDEVMRLSAQDPYRYDKAKFLVVTRQMRAQKAAGRQAEYIRAAAGELSSRLRDIACDDRRTLGERRRIIERLRDELDDATPDARAANDTITRFLAARFGPGDAENEVCPGRTPSREGTTQQPR